MKTFVDLLRKPNRRNNYTKRIAEFGLVTMVTKA